MRSWESARWYSRRLIAPDQHQRGHDGGAYEQAEQADCLTLPISAGLAAWCTTNDMMPPTTPTIMAVTMAPWLIAQSGDVPRPREVLHRHETAGVTGLR